MVSILRSDGVFTEKKIIYGIVDAGEEALQHLAELATDDENWDKLYDDTMAPLCAVHLLAMIKGYRVCLVINTAIINHHETADEWIVDTLPSILANTGVDSIPAIVGLLNYTSTDGLVRGSAEEALLMIAMKNPNLKPEIIETIKDTIQNEADIDMRAGLVYHLARLKKSSLYDYIKNLLESGYVQNKHFDLEYLDGMYAGKHDAHISKIGDPLRIFLSYIFNKNDYNSFMEAKEYAPARPKIGRNNSCPCGSGKKYKKCCMSKT